MASERAKPRMAYEKSCPFRVGFREQPIIKDPNTTPIPMPENTLVVKTNTTLKTNTNSN